MDQRGEGLWNKGGRNDAGAIIEAGRRYGNVGGVAIESCSGAANLAEELIVRAGWSVDLAHPGFVNRMKQNPDKSDFTDAGMLADLERVGYLPKVWLAPHDVRELRYLIRYRQQLANERRNAKLRIRALLRDQRVRGPHVRAWTNPWMAWLRSTTSLSEQGRWIIDRHLKKLDELKQDIAEAEVRLGRLTVADSLVHALMQQSGIGPVTAWNIRSEVGRFDRFRNGKQLTRWWGLMPRNAWSGLQLGDAGLIKAGNRHLRAVLIEAAHRLILFDKEWGRFADRLLSGGKPKCVVVAAVANRWMRRLYHRMQPSRLAA